MKKSINRISSLLGKPFSSKPFLSKRSGLTLIEIIIVIALLGTLMTYLVSQLTNVADSAKVDQAKIGMGGVGSALQIYRVHNSRYPTTEQGLDALLKDPGGDKKWRGPYIEEEKLRDPWGADFGYSSDGRDYKITSVGPDNAEGTADDITYPESAGGGEASK
jgi:general secretion pathway protein G